MLPWKPDGAILGKSQQTVDANPVLGYSWASVADSGPRINHHRVNLFYLDEEDPPKT